MTKNISSNIKQSPKDFKTAIILKDGTSLHLRAIRKDDEEKLVSLFYRLSSRTIYMRFRYPLKQMSREEARRYSTVDYYDSFALVVTISNGEEEKIIGVGRYYRLPVGNKARVLFVVEDAYQGKGIGTHLFEQIASVGRQNGIRYFEGEVPADNPEVVKMFKDIGFKTVEELEEGFYRMVLDLSPTSLVEEKTAEREEIATVASLKAFFEPRSVAVIGASQNPESLGNMAFTQLIHNNFKGVAYPVNPKADFVSAVKAYPSVLDIPGDVDLAVIIVPAKAVLSAVEQCGRKGVRGMVIITAGFSENGEEGKKLEAQIVDVARSYGMRMVGPNCMGVINTSPEYSMNATFSPVFPPPGNIAFASQSGGLGLAILKYARNLNIGISSFASIGNRADVSSNDLMQYWKDDPMTDVILLYLESFGNPRKFARIARSVSMVKPIIAMKSGRTSVGSKAAASHTGAMATSDAVIEALFKQTGIIRVDTLEELFDVAHLLSQQPVPKGKRVAILTNGGGPGILTADACISRGLELPDLSEKTKAKLKEILPDLASVNNPIDMIAGASGDEYATTLKLLLDNDNFDVVIALLIAPVTGRVSGVARAIKNIAPEYRKRGKTLVASFMSMRGAPAELIPDKGPSVPSFSYPEATAMAIAKAYEYGQWVKRSKGNLPEFSDIDRKNARHIIELAMTKGAGKPAWLDAHLVEDLLDCYGIKTVKSATAITAEEASVESEKLGFPVVIKLLSETIAHKTEVGGVVLNVRSPLEAEQAFNQIKERLAGIGKEPEMQGVTIQKMIPDGTEVIIGVTQDPSFGPLILFGLGGIYTELFKDTTFRIHPLTDIDAYEMVRAVKAFKLLEGWRGSTPRDIEALEELLLRISVMIEDIPEISELDLNPVKVLDKGKGYTVVDFRILLG